MASAPGTGFLSSLSPRDRRILIYAAGFFGVLGVSLLVLTLKGRLDDKASRVRTAKDTLEVLYVMEAQYLEAAQRIEASEERLKEYEGQRLPAFIESMAAQSDVRDLLRQVDDQGTETVGNVKQTTYKVVLKKVPLAGALDFLYDVETAGYPLQVERAVFTTVFVSGEKMVDLELGVVTLTLTEGA